MRATGGGATLPTECVARMVGTRLALVRLVRCRQDPSW
jgi:hypothetical protein